MRLCSMEMERRALYNLLLMNYFRDDTLDVEKWQVEDYRALDTEEILLRLDNLDIALEIDNFLVLSNKYDTPEDLADIFIDTTEEIVIQDQIYLLVFELWRRFIPEKLSFSVFCDELDHSINSYDRGDVENTEHLEDLIANLQIILDENIDEGGKPSEIFTALTANCANDIESFLYDFISEELDNNNTSYASELVEGFTEYISDAKWFTFLQARLVARYDFDESAEIISSLFAKTSKTSLNLEFCFDVLSFLVQDGTHKLFVPIAKKTLCLLNTEDDFRELLEICIEYFSYLDSDEHERAIQTILDQRLGDIAAAFDQEDPAKHALVNLLDFPLFFSPEESKS